MCITDVKQEVRDVGIFNVKVKAIIERVYSSNWFNQEHSVEVQELSFDFGNGIIIKIPADYINENCLKNESFWHLIFEKLGY